jgi:hypothetical protein
MKIPRANTKESISLMNTILSSRYKRIQETAEQKLIALFKISWHPKNPEEGC